MELVAGCPSDIARSGGSCRKSSADSRSRAASLFGNKSAAKWLEQSSPALLLECADGVGTLPCDDQEEESTVDTVQDHSLWATLEGRSFCLSPELDT